MIATRHTAYTTLNMPSMYKSAFLSVSVSEVIALLINLTIALTKTVECYCSANDDDDDDAIKTDGPKLI